MHLPLVHVPGGLLNTIERRYKHILKGYVLPNVKLSNRVVNKEKNYLKLVGCHPNVALVNKV